MCAPTPLQVGAARGVASLGAAYYDGIIAEHETKRDQLCAALERAGLPACMPQGAYYILADVSRLPGRTSKERVMHLLHATGVAAVPGEAFFRGAAGHTLARFCFGKTDADLAQACERLGRL